MTAVFFKDFIHFRNLFADFESGKTQMTRDDSICQDQRVKGRVQSRKKKIVCKNTYPGGGGSSIGQNTYLFFKCVKWPNSSINAKKFFQFLGGLGCIFPYQGGVGSRPRYVFLHTIFFFSRLYPSLMGSLSYNIDLIKWKLPLPFVLTR